MPLILRSTGPFTAGQEPPLSSRTSRVLCLQFYFDLCSFCCATDRPDGIPFILHSLLQQWEEAKSKNPSRVGDQAWVAEDELFCNSNLEKVCKHKVHSCLCCGTHGIHCSQFDGGSCIGCLIHFFVQQASSASHHKGSRIHDGSCAHLLGVMHAPGFATGPLQNFACLLSLVS